MAMTREARQPVNIDGIEFDALIEETLDYESEIPQYPTEKGFEVSDTIIRKSEKLSMTLYLTETPVTWWQRHGSEDDRINTVMQKLKKLYAERKLVTVTTSEDVYDNMAIASISFKKTLDVGYAREIPITFQHVIVTETATVDVPPSYGRGGASEASAGAAQTEEKEQPEQESTILGGLFG